MAVKILMPHEIKQPRIKGLIHETHPKDWTLGHPTLGATFQSETLFPDKNCVPYITELNDLQRNENFDEFCCVIHGTINNVQLLVKKKYGITLDLSKRDLANRVPVIPNQGTSIRAASETLRTGGCALERDYPTLTPVMTQDEFFTPLKGIQEYLLANGFVYNHVNLPSTWLGATMESIIDNGLLSSGVIVAIEGSYHFDEEGRLQYQGGAYNHVVLVVQSLPDCFLVLDSENPNGLMRVRRDYNFSSPKIASINLTKPLPMNNLWKKNGQPAIGLYVPDNGGILLFADGVDVNGKPIAGGSVFKAAGWLYSDAQKCDEWPYPIVGQFTEVPKV